MHKAILHSFGDQQGRLIQIPILEAECQRSVFLVIPGFDVDVLIQQGQDGKEMVLEASVVQDSSLVNIHQIKINIPVSDKHLKDLNFLQGLHCLLDSLHIAKTVKDRRPFILV